MKESYAPEKLRDLELQPEYRSDEDRIVDDFYVPCFSVSHRYHRAVGYFTSQGLSLGARGLARFVRGGGLVRLVASPFFQEEDIDAIRKGYQAREDVIERALLRPLEQLDDLERERLAVIAWLIAEQRLEVRVAFRADERGGLLNGIYHEKVGIFEDGTSDRVMFTGSPNETIGGLVSNFESIDVFRSWHDPEKRVERKLDNFERLWNNSTSGLEVVRFPDAVAGRLLELKPNSPPNKDPEETLEPPPKGEVREHPDVLRIPPDLKLRSYQEDAIKSWLREEGRGLFKMATGTGKTVMALGAATILGRQHAEKGIPLAIVVVCPFRHLVTQWRRAVEWFGLTPLTCFESRKKWSEDFDDGLLTINQGTSSLLFIITTNATFGSEAFQARLKRIQSPFLLIADEVHNLGAEKLQQHLPESAEYRVGLSATPERWFDDSGTDRLKEYFGDIVFEFTLGDAIKHGALTPYTYHPILVSLTEFERQKYLKLSRDIARKWASTDGDDLGEDHPAKYLLIQRARLLATAEQKLKRLKDIMSHRRDTTHNLFYCGDGRVEYDPDDITLRQVDAVVRLLGKELRMTVDRYTAETHLEDREDLRSRFAEGKLQGLVAIRCLDEGVDIPETRRAWILASSSNPKQFIQRRGRVLRLAEGKKVAEIHDFLVVPPDLPEESATFNMERRMLEKELKRVSEFAALAQNEAVAKSKLLPLKEQFHLLHL